MKKSCVDCVYLKERETKTSKIPYGYCIKLKMPLIAVQANCKYYKFKEIVPETA